MNAYGTRKSEADPAIYIYKPIATRYGIQEEEAGPGRPEIYPFSELRVGEYFLMPEGYGSIETARSLASYRGRSLGARFSVATTSKGRKKVTRVA